MKNTFTEFLNAKYEIKDNCCYGELEIRNDCLNPLGSIHGGVLFALADETGGYLALSCYNGKTPTVDANIHFLSPAIGVEKLFSKATIIKKGKNLMVLNVQIASEKDKAIAQGTFTYMDIGK